MTVNCGTYMCYDVRAAAATHGDSQCRCTRCTGAPTKRCSSPVEVVLTGSRAALPGLIEILKGPCWGHGASNKG